MGGKTRDHLFCVGVRFACGRLTAMAMRAPQTGSADVGDKQQALPEDHPVLRAMLTAPPATEPMTEDERLALAEWRANPCGVDDSTVSAMIAERAAREG